MLMLCNLAGNAQKFYLKGQVGYDFGFLKSQINMISDHVVYTYDSATVTSSYEVFKNSYGTGFSFGAGAGIMMGKFMSFELGAFYTTCKEQKLEGSTTIVDEQGYHYNGYSHYKLKGRCYGFKPAFTIFIPGENVRPYARVGAVLAFTKLKEDMTMNVTTDNYNYLHAEGYQYTLEYKTRFSAGVNFALGMEFSVGKRVWMYAEVEGNFLNYSPVSATYTDFIIGHENVTNKLNVHQREIEFVKSYSDSDNDNNSQPTKAPRLSYSFSSLALNVGIRYTLFD